jgi:hypothetical protein
MSESKHQQAVIQVIKLLPWGDLLFAIPNGGHRNKFTAVTLKKEGVTAGIPDMFLAYPRGEYHGLFIEMKFGKNKPTKMQAYYLDRFSKLGYMCIVCYDAEQAINEIMDYVKDT